MKKVEPAYTIFQIVLLFTGMIEMNNIVKYHNYLYSYEV